MWIFLKDAFLSIVEDKTDPHGGTLLVRARARGDIERIFPTARVSTTPGRDYRFRASLPSVAVANAIADEITRIGYGNFKDSVSENDRHNAYLRVWSTMSQWQEFRYPKQEKHHAASTRTRSALQAGEDPRRRKAANRRRD